MDSLIEAAAALQPDYVDEERPDIRQGWTPATLTDADFALRRIAECQQQLADVDALEAAAIEQIRARCEKLRKAPRGLAAFFESSLKAYMARERGTLLKGKAKSRGFVYGTLGWRAHKEKLAVTDKAALQAWLDELPEGSPLVRVKREPNMDALKEHLATTGEIPAGCELVPASDDPYVTAEAPASTLAVKE